MPGLRENGPQLTNIGVDSRVSEMDMALTLKNTFLTQMGASMTMWLCFPASVLENQKPANVLWSGIRKRFMARKRKKKTAQFFPQRLFLFRVSGRLLLMLQDTKPTVDGRKINRYRYRSGKRNPSPNIPKILTKLKGMIVRITTTGASNSGTK